MTEKTQTRIAIIAVVFSIIMLVIFIPRSASATEIDELVYNPQLDTEEVAYIAFVESDTFYKNFPTVGTEQRVEEVKQGSVIYVVKEIQHIDSGITYLELNTIYGVRFIADVYTIGTTPEGFIMPDHLSKPVESRRIPTNNPDGEKAVDSQPSSVPSSEHGGTYAGNFKISFYGVDAGGGSNDARGVPLADQIGQIVGTYAFPQGTRLWIDGWGERIVRDKGTNHIDLLVSSEAEANAIGIQYRDIWIIE